MRSLLLISFVSVFLCSSPAFASEHGSEKWKDFVEKADVEIASDKYQDAKQSLARAWLLIQSDGQRKRDFDTVRQSFVRLYLKAGDKIRASNCSIDGWNETFGIPMNEVASGAVSDPVDGAKSNYFVLRKDETMEFHLGSPPHDFDVRVIKPGDKEYKTYRAKVGRLEVGKSEPLIYLPDGWSYSPSKDKASKEWLKKITFVSAWTNNQIIRRNSEMRFSTLLSMDNTFKTVGL